MRDAAIRKGGGIEHVQTDDAAAANADANEIKDAVQTPGPSLDDGGAGDAHDGRAHSGFTGDDGAHQPTDSQARPSSSQPGIASGLGAGSDVRNHDMPPDATQRVTGSNAPNEGGIAGSPGGPKSGPHHIPGDSDAADVVNEMPNKHNDQRKSQI